MLLLTKTTTDRTGNKRRSCVVGVVVPTNPLRLILFEQMLPPICLCSDSMTETFSNH